MEARLVNSERTNERYNAKTILMTGENNNNNNNSG
jgi:hypothetical protein